jgi:hypothetical protein
MLLALERPRPQTSQLELFCEFLTGKELDPNFVDFNSVNRRYHFPARFYLPFRGVFAQVDPLITSSALSRSLGTVSKVSVEDLKERVRQIKLRISLFALSPGEYFEVPDEAQAGNILRPYEYSDSNPPMKTDPTGLGPIVFAASCRCGHCWANITASVVVCLSCIDSLINELWHPEKCCGPVCRVPILLRYAAMHLCMLTQLSNLGICRGCY